MIFTHDERGPVTHTNTGHKLDIDWSYSSKVIAMTIGIFIGTVHMYDIKDEEGDREANRRTLPIEYPILSRILLLLGLPVWSILVPVICGLCGRESVYCTSLLLSLGLTTAVRCLQREALWS
jgi:4-hydroxybenzoate polyprenyltransferase